MQPNRGTLRIDSHAVLLPEGGFSVFKISSIVAVSALFASITSAQIQMPHQAFAGELLNHAQLAQLELGETHLIHHFPLGDAGNVALDLTRFSILGPDTRIVEIVGENERELADTQLVLLRGSIVGEDDDSTAFIAVGPWGINGFISRQTTGEFFSITTGPYTGLLAPDAPLYVTSNFQFTQPIEPFCGYDPNDPFLNPPREQIEQAQQDSLTVRGTTPCSQSSIAIDTDYEFTANLFGGNTSASANYAITLLAATSIIFERDTGTTLALAYLRVWATDTDPYGGSDMGEFLEGVRNTWISTMGSVSRTVVHGLSARNLGGGVAWLNVLCNTQWGYAVSANLGGSFPLPMVNHSHANWDIFVFAHELGHNFGTLHTHDGYDPVIDGCGNGDCSQAWGGTIMSYCHGCAGGMSNIVLGFHPRTQTVIRDTVAAASCITTSPTSLAAAPDSTYTIQTQPVTIDVLRNDIDVSCGVPTIASFDPASAGGGTISLVTGADRNRLRYTAALGYSGIDTFQYTINNGQSTTVSVEVFALRAPDSPIQPQPGIRVHYYALNNPNTLPDFSLLTPYHTEIVSQINFPSTSGQFAGSGRVNNVGAVFTGYVQVALPGMYRFSTESDDGSMLWVGDRLVVDNNGLHGMRVRSGVVALLPGKHAVRVEFFEAGGSAGLIVRNAYDPGDFQVIPPSAWFYSDIQPCAADFNNDGNLDFFDVQAFLGAFTAHHPTADINSDGIWNFFDVQQYLALFSTGCP